MIERRIVAVAILMVIATAILPSQARMTEPPRIIVSAVDAPGPDRFLAEQLRSQLLVRIVNDAMFRVVSDVALEAVLREQTLPPDALDDADAAAGVAERLDADYRLAGSFAVTRDAGTWSLELTNVYSGEVIWSGIYPVDLNRPGIAVRTVADELAQFGREVRMVQLDDVRALLELGQVDRAERLFTRYLERNRLTDEARQLKGALGAARARDAYETALRYAQVWLFEDALVEINRAIALDPDNPAYRETIEDIRAARTAREDASFRRKIDVVTRLVDEGYYGSASVLLNEIQPQDHPAVGALRERLTGVAGARLDYESALAAYWDAEYDLARARVRTAIDREPTRPEYAELLEAIDDADANRRRSEEVWNRYRDRAAETDFLGALVGPVRVLPVWEYALGRGSYRFRDTVTLNETEIPQTIAAAVYRRPYLLRWGARHEAFSLHAGWHLGGVYRGGGEEDSGASDAGGDARRVSRLSVRSLGAAGGGFVQAQVLAFSLRLALETEQPLVLASELRRDAAIDADSREHTPVWMPTVLWSGSLIWHVNERNYLALTLSRAVASASVPNLMDEAERYRPRGFLIGYGRRR